MEIIPPPHKELSQSPFATLPSPRPPPGLPPRPLFKYWKETTFSLREKAAMDQLFNICAKFFCSAQGRVYERQSETTVKLGNALVCYSSRRLRKHKIFLYLPFIPIADIFIVPSTLKF